MTDTKPRPDASQRTSAPRGALLEAFCVAWEQADELLAIARRQAIEIEELRARLQAETNRADYWHARAVSPGAVEILPPQKFPHNSATGS